MSANKIVRRRGVSFGISPFPPARSSVFLPLFDPPSVALELARSGLPAPSASPLSLSRSPSGALPARGEARRGASTAGSLAPRRISSKPMSPNHGGRARFPPFLVFSHSSLYFST
ncbi:hypothetical protein AAFF_G00394410 [Aldrovandia affinis]|uniref:Uncharacterized protein n=1 Tax=Aldrovandia affinis TaxID=143900 RepID=A0AAD7SE82_9TELE|nr:hypothetical protein AAFF_G00394410 [Aldrovandia affinis]